MTRWRRTVVSTGFGLALLVCLASGSIVAQPAAPARAGNVTAVGSLARTVTDHKLVLTKDLALTPDRPGEIRVTASYDTPSNLAKLRVDLPVDATVTDTRGFTRSNGRYVWDERTRTPTITYRLSVNETRAAVGPIAGDGQFLFVDAGPWALVRTPQLGTQWSSTRSAVPLSTSTTVDGPGAVGHGEVFLGPYRDYERTAHDQHFRLIVPDSADLAASPTGILDTVSNASDRLRVGDRDRLVFMIAAPTGDVTWAVNGLETGDADLWVRDRSRLDVADNVWIHEYVHTRQAYNATAETRWFTEASATYYAALFALEDRQIDFPAFRDRLALGQEAPHASTVLSDPSSWQEVAPYTKGALVAGELDRQTRLATAGNSLQTVFRQLNAYDGMLSQSAFEGAVRSAGRSQVAALAERYTTTEAVPSMWNTSQHIRAFETPLPNVRARLADDNASAFRTSGPYRSELVGDARPIRLATGETLTVGVVVENTGTAAGDYETRVRINGATVARRNGTLAANATTRWRVSHTFADPGEYALTVGDSRVDVAVSPPATATVETLTMTDPHPTRGETVTLTATVGNDAAIPAASTLSLEQNGTRVDSQQVALAPGERRTITFERSLATAGPVQFRLGDRTLTVTVRPPPSPTATRSVATGSRAGGGTAGTGAGFGAGLAVVALVLVALLARRRD